MNTLAPRLTDLAHGGGCGCKLAPSVLQQLLATHPAARLLPSPDDAAVWQVGDSTCVIATDYRFHRFRSPRIRT